MIKSFILCTGQEFVSEVLSEDESTYTVKRPLVVHVMRGADGAPTLAFAPLSMIQDSEEVKIYKCNLVHAPVPIMKEVSDSYIENTTGIALPKTSSGKILLG